MATATAPKLSERERLEKKRAALLIRKAELQDVIDTAPQEIAIKRETWVRSESPAHERAVHRAKQAEKATLEELAEVDAKIALVDRLLADELSKQKAIRDAEVRAAAVKFVEAQEQAVAAFARGFQKLYAEEYGRYVETLTTLGGFCAVHRDVFGEHPPFPLDPTPVRFRSLLEACWKAQQRDPAMGDVAAVLADAITAVRDVEAIASARAERKQWLARRCELEEHVAARLVCETPGTSRD